MYRFLLIFFIIKQKLCYPYPAFTHAFPRRLGAPDHQDLAMGAVNARQHHETPRKAVPTLAHSSKEVFYL